MKQSLNLLEQIIEMAEVQSKELDAFNILRHKASKTLGENAVVFYLKQLRDLLQEEAKSTKTVNLGDKTFSIALGNGWTGSPETHPGIPCIVGDYPLGNFAPYEQTR